MRPPPFAPARAAGHELASTLFDTPTAAPHAIPFSKRLRTPLRQNARFRRMLVLPQSQSPMRGARKCTVDPGYAGGKSYEDPRVQQYQAASSSKYRKGGDMKSSSALTFAFILAVP